MAYSKTNNQKDDVSKNTRQQRAPLYEPLKERVLLIIGQDLGAIGGMPGYQEGYMDQPGLPKPVGFTTYTSFDNGQTNNGLTQLDNWGAGDEYADMLLQHPALDKPMIAVGLYLDPNLLSCIGNGGLDAEIIELGQWIKRTQLPVFLRIGYEFEFNGYPPEEYVAAFRRVVDVMDESQVKNVSYVWQAASLSNIQTLEFYEHYYPGDNYVDWVAYSYFYNEDHGQRMIEFAREHNKPVMLAETCPARYDLLERAHGSEVDPSYPLRQNVNAWQEWFSPMFDWVEQHCDVIKAVAYINVDWMSQPMWQDETSLHYPYWMGTDSRIQADEELTKNWTKAIKAAESRWITGQLQPGEVRGF